MPSSLPRQATSPVSCAVIYGKHRFKSTMIYVNIRLNFQSEPFACDKNRAPRAILNRTTERASRVEYHGAGQPQPKARTMNADPRSSVVSFCGIHAVFNSLGNCEKLNSC